ncbi:hypothetical protein L3Q82_020813, partial [Scortum barcoo]
MWDVVGCVSEGNDCEYRKVIMDFVDCTLGVHKYNKLGVHLNNKLDWTDNTDSLYKRGSESSVHAEEAGIFGCVQATAEDLFMRLWWRLWSPMQWSAGEGGCSERDKKRLNRLIQKSQLSLWLPPGLH